LDERALLEVVKGIIGKDCCLDDCAVFSCNGYELVATTDMLHTSTDFPACMTDWQIGWMSAAVTLSDIAAMGARPLMLLLAVGLDRSGRLHDIMKGAEACCISVGTHVAGGDIDNHHELTIVSSGIGYAKKGRIVRRKGSRPGDCIGVTGVPGRAQASLSGYREFDRSLTEPKPRVPEGIALSSAGATSMMDVSDGLSFSLYDMIAANSCGYSIQSSKIPLPHGINPELALPMALYGGGDFELLFTIPAGSLPVQGVAYTIIGEVIPEREVLLDGIPMEKRGYEHTWDR
jgi:thiamine-monophosphate kinase